jgi:hypothetical protein
MLYALGAAIAWGAACGLLSAQFWGVVVGGLAAAALALWLEWDALKRSSDGNRNFYLMIAAAYVFLAMVGVGVVSLGYYLGEWLLAKLAHL